MLPRERWRDAGNEVELQSLLQKSDSTTVWPFPEALCMYVCMYIQKGMKNRINKGLSLEISLAKLIFKM